MPTASVPPPAAEVLPAERERDPDLWLRALAWSVVAFSIAQVLLFSFGRDQGIYAVIGRGLLEGQMPYRDLWDFKPPGIFFVYASSFAVFGPSMIAPRLVEGLCLFAVVLGCRRLGGVLFQSRTAGLLGGAIAALLHAELEFWHTGQPETFAGALTIGALVLCTHDWSRRRAPLAHFVLGVLLGAAFLLKPPLAAPALVCGVYLALVRRAHGHRLGQQWLPTLFIALGSAVPLICTGLWFRAQGAWPELAWTLGDFAPGYTRLSWVGRTPWDLYGYALFEGFFKLSALLGSGLVLAVAFDGRARVLRGAHALLFAVAAVQLAGVALQGKFFQYHYAATLPVLSVSAGAGFYRLWRRFGVGSPVGSVAFALLLTALTVLRLPVRDLPGGFWARSVQRMSFLISGGRTVSREELDRDLYYVADYNLVADRDVAAEIARRVPSTESVYVWGFEPALYWFSERRPASRFIYNVPQRATWQAARARALLLADLDRDPPRAIIVQHADVFPFVTGDALGSADSLPAFPALEARLARDYAFVARIEDFELHMRRALATAGTAGAPVLPGVSEAGKP